MMCIVNGNRQIVFANNALLKNLEVDYAGLYGKRPGEALQCQYSFDTSEKCGTSESCQFCGAFLSIKSGLEGIEKIDECSIHQQISGDVIELKVSSSPIVVNNTIFVVFTMKDISDLKRREVLERVFFHDIMNSASGMYHLAELMEMDLPEEYNEYKHLILNSSKKLIDEITAQRQLVNAEKGALSLSPVEINSNDFLDKMIEVNSHYTIAEKSKLSKAEGSEDFNFISDSAILGRIVTNLMKNALEAEYPSGEVSSGAKKKGDSFIIWVNNTAYMRREIQLQIFKKSFSTKGVGRGIGAYSIKMFAEKYLKGKVSFQTSPEEGTTFFMEFPLDIFGGKHYHE
jgi:signal transduction histidine kinase